MVCLLKTYRFFSGFQNKGIFFLLHSSMILNLSHQVLQSVFLPAEESGKATVESIDIPW